MDNLQTKKIHSLPTTELTEEQEKELINELNTAPVIYEWTVNVPPFFVMKLIALFNLIASILMGLTLSIINQSFIHLFFGSVMGIILCCFTRYLWMANKIYHYQLTPIGVRYTTQDNIPDLAFIIVRMIAWFGVAVCIFAVVIVGPLALVGAGGMALLSFSLTKFSSKIDHDFFYFKNDYQINILRKSNVFSLTSEPFSLESYGCIYCKKEQVDYVIGKFTPYLKNYKTKEINSYLDL